MRVGVGVGVRVTFVGRVQGGVLLRALLLQLLHDRLLELQLAPQRLAVGLQLRDDLVALVSVRVRVRVRVSVRVAVGDRVRVRVAVRVRVSKRVNLNPNPPPNPKPKPGLPL